MNNLKSKPDTEFNDAGKHEQQKRIDFSNICFFLAVVADLPYKTIKEL